MYICVSWIFTYALANTSVHVSLLFWGLTITMSFCLSPIPRFNKADWFYSQSLPMWGCCTVKTMLSECLHTWFVDWYIYVLIYVFLRYTTSSCTLLALFSLERKWLCHDFLTFYSFVFIYIRKWHDINVFHLCYIVNKRQLRKTL